MVHRPRSTAIVLALSVLACALSLWRATAQAPVMQPLALCPPIGQPCPTPEGCYPAIRTEEWFCANMAGSCCQYTHQHYWYKDIVTGEACDPAECIDYTLVQKKDNYYCAPSKLCLPN